MFLTLSTAHVRCRNRSFLPPRIAWTFRLSPLTSNKVDGISLAKLCHTIDWQDWKSDLNSGTLTKKKEWKSIAMFTNSQQHSDSIHESSSHSVSKIPPSRRDMLTKRGSSRRLLLKQSKACSLRDIGKGSTRSADTTVVFDPFGSSNSIDTFSFNDSCNTFANEDTEGYDFDAATCDQLSVHSSSISFDTVDSIEHEKDRQRKNRRAEQCSVLSQSAHVPSQARKALNDTNRQRRDDLGNSHHSTHSTATNTSVETWKQHQGRLKTRQSYRGRSERTNRYRSSGTSSRRLRSSSLPRTTSKLPDGECSGERRTKIEKSHLSLTSSCHTSRSYRGNEMTRAKTKKGRSVAHSQEGRRML